MKNIQENLGQRGITLIALIITIIVLLILAGVSIAMLTGENGILSRAESTNYASAQGELLEKISLSISESLMDRDTTHTIESVLEIAEANGFISNTTHTISKTIDESEYIIEAEIVHNETGATVILTEISAGNIQVASGEKTTVAATVPQIKVPESVEDIVYQTSKVTNIDSNGNEVVIPEGFGISSDSGINITEGIVIEDTKGNQFVWIPLGEELVKADGTKAVVKLGRYETFEIGEEPKSLDYGIANYYEEGTDDYGLHVEETKDGTLNYENAIATDIEAFIEDAEKNGGYYMGRFETTAEVDGAVTVTKDGTLLTRQTQSEAASSSKSMYGEGDSVTSDLVNSLAWDTSIMYIQNFSTKEGAETYAQRLANTDTSNDVYCNIWDMSSGVWEWSTETSSKPSNPSSYRGGYSTGTNHTAGRNSGTTVNKATSVGSRVVIIGLGD